MGRAAAAAALVPALALAGILASVAAAGQSDTLKVDVNLVSVLATVTDDEGGVVSGLEREDFILLEDGVERPIELFEGHGSLSSSIGILIDNSGSSADILDSIRSGVSAFAGALSSEDETFAMSFAIETRLIHDFGEPSARLATALGGLKSWGTSVLFDALRSAIEKSSSGRHERKALIVLTDGQDNRSQSSYRDVVRAAQRHMVLLYFIGMGSPMLVDTHTLNGLAAMTGGRVVLLEGAVGVSEALGRIRDEFASHYYLGYHASPTPGYHSIRVETRRAGLRVRARDGYLVR